MSQVLKKSLTKDQAGFFIFNMKIFDFIEKNKNVVLEKKPLEKLVKMKNLISYKHKGFWQCCDNKKDYDLLCEYFKKKKPII